MAVVISTVGVIALFVLAFLIDISINLRRVDGNIKKMIAGYNKVHSTSKP